MNEQLQLFMQSYQKKFFRILRKINEKKMFLIKIYFLTLKRNFQHFLKIVKIVKKKKELKSLSLYYNFHVNCVETIKTMKKYTRWSSEKKFETFLKLFYFFQILKKRVKFYKKFRKSEEFPKILENKQKSLNFKEKYFKIKGFLYLKDLLKQKEQIIELNSLLNKYKENILKRYVKCLIEIQNKRRKFEILKTFIFLKQFLKIREKERLSEQKIRKFQFLSKNNFFITNLTKYHRRKLDKEATKQNKIAIFYIFVFLNKIKRIIQNKKDENFMITNYLKKYVFEKFKKIKKIADLRKNYFEKIQLFSNYLKKHLFRKFFERFKVISLNLFTKEESFRKGMLLKEFYLKIKDIMNTNLKRKSQIYSLQRFIEVVRKKETVSLLLYFSKFLPEQRTNIILSKKIKIKLSYNDFIKNINKIKDERNKRTNDLAKSKKFLLTKLIKKSFSSLKFNKLIKKHKKQEFSQILEERQKIITKNLINNLITYSTKQLNKAEHLMSKKLMQKKEKAINLALKWFNILKSKVTLKKLKNKQSSSIKSLESTSTLTLNKQILVPPQPKSSHLLTEDLNLLLTLKNKKRNPPKKLLNYL